ncbi:hypothetical protein GL263_10815 [Streptomyces durbertensis]|uniref:Uncharacterized protein n=1 Tax=Streptomyces durbertensis TaxID=2448886 RepID=A0ABR6EFD5_9ACTN|nr:hypothetical protein [Streptomyces durbertensis]MBB1244046.1 hypothetical protein [Streptomyces durbertensis]
MGWTHDFRDTSRGSREGTVRDSNGTSDPGQSGRGGARPRLVAAHTAHATRDPRLGIPRILRRRARWMGARLRHTRG